MLRAVESSFVRNVLKPIPAGDSQGDERRNRQPFGVADHRQLVRRLGFHQ